MTRSQKILIFVSLVGTNAIIWLGILATNFYNRPFIAFLDVGQGDAILLSDGDQQLLIDAGRDGGVVTRVAKLLPPWDRTIEYVIATHSDSDHIGGYLKLLDYYTIENLFVGDAEIKTEIAREMYQKFVDTGSVITPLWRGDTITINGWNILTLWPKQNTLMTDETNDRSVVVRADYHDFSTILTGDASTQIENWITEHTLQDILDIDILKLGHHGSRTSSSEMFLNATTPQAAIISAGCNNSYGHPHKEIIERMEFLSIPYRTTCSEGTVIYRFK